MRWRPFTLDPTLPPGSGMNKRELYERKFGARAPAIVEAMTATFAEMGETYSIGGNVGDTFDSHRLLAYAESLDDDYATQNALVEELFKDYFTREKCVSDRDVLLAAAQAVGLQDAAKVLDDPTAFADTVEDQKRAFAGRHQIRGVPYFIIDGKYHLSGAQPPDILAEAIEEAIGVA